jgi:hypothetical protein
MRFRAFTSLSSSQEMSLFLSKEKTRPSVGIGSFMGFRLAFNFVKEIYLPIIPGGISRIQCSGSGKQDFYIAILNEYARYGHTTRMNHF